MMDGLTEDIARRGITQEPRTLLPGGRQLVFPRGWPCRLLQQVATSRHWAAKAPRAEQKILYHRPMLVIGFNS